ncbi:MAG: hypothetical protein CMO55_17515 [Verrucomicrobiales bacterium]|nr:hypothetical protein [Verrucomicrobiales bacterium]
MIRRLPNVFDRLDNLSRWDIPPAVLARKSQDLFQFPGVQEGIRSVCQVKQKRVYPATGLWALFHQLLDVLRKLLERMKGTHASSFRS